MEAMRLTSTEVDITGGRTRPYRLGEYLKTEPWPYTKINDTLIAQLMQRQRDVRFNSGVLGNCTKSCKCHAKLKP